MPERDGDAKPERPDYLTDFPEEFEQRPGGPPRDQARRAEPRPASESARERIEQMKRRVEELAREGHPEGPREDGER